MNINAAKRMALDHIRSLSNDELQDGIESLRETIASMKGDARVPAYLIDEQEEFMQLVLKERNRRLN